LPCGSKADMPADELIWVKNPDSSTAKKSGGPKSAYGGQVMPNRQRTFGAIGILLIATTSGVSAQTVAPAARPDQAIVQIENPPAGTRVKVWTRSKLDAAKKRWAQNQEKFSDCQKQLGERQKVKRLSLHNQGHFLEQCMLRKS